jgi:hypothetical protein
VKNTPRKAGVGIEYARISSPAGGQLMGDFPTGEFLDRSE